VAITGENSPPVPRIAAQAAHGPARPAAHPLPGQTPDINPGATAPVTADLPAS